MVMAGSTFLPPLVAVAEGASGAAVEVGLGVGAGEPVDEGLELVGAGQVGAFADA